MPVISLLIEATANLVRAVFGIPAERSASPSSIVSDGSSSPPTIWTTPLNPPASSSSRSASRSMLTSRVTASALGHLELARIGERGRSPGGARCRHRPAIDPDRIVDAADEEVAGRGPAQGGPDRRHL